MKNLVKQAPESDRNQATHRLLGFLVSKKRHYAETAEAEPSDAHPKRILVVDDDPVIRATTSNRLTMAGHQVSTATDGAEAISAVRDQKPDVILLDVNFPPDVANAGVPTWDGFRLMYWLRGLQNTEGTRYIFISGTDSSEFKDRARSAGALAFLSKPIDHERLLKVIASEAKTQPDPPQPRRWWIAFFDLL